MSDDAYSPLAKRYKTESTSDLEISPVLTDLSQDKSVDFYRIEKTIFDFCLVLFKRQK
jgi:hypothetical protein